MAEDVVGPDLARIQAKNPGEPCAHSASRRRDACRAYRDALAIEDEREQLRARFAALMALAEARGG